MAVWQGIICGVKYMNDFLESKMYKLTCIAPVHIGSGEQLKSFEYLYNRDRQQVYFLNNGKWAQFLVTRNLMEEFSSLLDRSGNVSRMNLWEWLKRKRFHEKDCGLFVKRKASLQAELSDKKGTLNDIHTGICDGTGALYIPGSSIKGALRTGILFHLLEQNSDIKSRVKARIMSALNGDMRGFKREAQKIIGDLEKSLLEKKVQDGNKTFERKYLAGLQVGDAHVKKLVDSVVLQRYDVSTLKNATNHGNPLPLFWECIPAGSELFLRISIDKPMLQKLGIDSIEEIIGYCQAYMNRALKVQVQVFSKFGRQYNEVFSEAKAADFFLGAGTGFLQKSLWLSLFDNDKQAIIGLKKFLNNAFWKHKHLSLDKDISPRTLKLAVSRTDMQMMGMCRLEVMS